MIQQFYSWAYIQRKWKTLIWKDTCTPVFIAALFTIAKIWKPPKCPLIDEWIEKMWYINIQWNISHEKEWNLAICDNMEKTKQKKQDKTETDS